VLPLSLVNRGAKVGTLTHRFHCKSSRFHLERLIRQIAQLRQNRLVPRCSQKLTKPD